MCAPGRDADWRTDTLFDCTAVRHGWRNWLAEQDEALPDDQRVHLASTYAVGLHAAERCSGLAMTLDTFADDAIADGRLVRPFGHVSDTPESYWILDPRPGHRSDAAEAFRSWLLHKPAAKDAAGGSHSSA